MAAWLFYISYVTMIELADAKDTPKKSFEQR